MASWKELIEAEPVFASALRARFDAQLHKTMATLRRDGSPRLSGVEVTFGEDELWLGMMPSSRKAEDLLRDPRLALHSATVDPELTHGDAKLSGRAEELTDQASFDTFRSAQGEQAKGGAPEAGSFHLFRVDVDEAVIIRIGDPADHLVIEIWHPGSALRRIERR